MMPVPGPSGVVKCPECEAPDLFITYHQDSTHCTCVSCDYTIVYLYNKPLQDFTPPTLDETIAHVLATQTKAVYDAKHPKKNPALHYLIGQVIRRVYNQYHEVKTITRKVKEALEID